MRSLYYLATVVSSYRKLIDNFYDNSLTDDLLLSLERVLGRVANRETSGHYLKHFADETDQYYTGRQELSNQDFLALITDYDVSSSKITMLERNYFSVGDEVEIFTPNGDVYCFVVDNLYDHDGKPIKIARHPDEVLYMNFVGDIVPYSMMRRRIL